MKLSREQIKQIQEALLSGYDEPSLRMMVRIELGEDLTEIAGGDSLPLRVRVFNLISWAEKCDRVFELIDGAKAQQERNADINQVWQASQQWRQTDVAKVALLPTPPQEQSGDPGASSPTTYDVFLSYSHKDEAFMLRLFGDLRAAGLTVWIDQGLEPGTPVWQVEVENSIRKSRSIVVVLSPQAKASKWVNIEIAVAEANELRIFPVLAEGDFKNAVPFALATTQFVDARQAYGQTVQDRLLPALKRHLGVTEVVKPKPTEPSKQEAPPVEPPKPVKQRPDAKAAPPAVQAVSQPSGGPGAVASSTVSNIAASLGIHWITIPTGGFLMGSDNDRDDEKPQHNVHLPEYRISKYPVTNTQYQAFVKAASYKSPQHWLNGNIPQGKENHPVVAVSWLDVMEFCKWAGVRLPTEAEWEKAARGTDGRRYPWGDEPPTKDLCNFGNNEGGTTPVGNYPKCTSLYGVLDMAGNVWEWTGSLYRPYPYDASDGQESPEPDDVRVLRGGAFGDVDYYVRCSVRDWVGPDFALRTFGFRVVLSPSTAGR